MALAVSMKQQGAALASDDAVNADLLRFLPELIGTLGGEPKAILERNGVDPSFLADGSGTAGYRQIGHSLEAAAQALKRPDFGMRLARLQGGGSVFGPLGVVMRNSQTLGDAKDYVIKHAHVHSQATRIAMRSHRAGRETFVTHDILLDSIQHKAQMIEQFMLLAQLNVAEITGGRARVRKVLFQHHPISPISSYRRYFGCDVFFGQHADGVVYSDDDLRCPIVDPDVQLHAAMTAYIDAQFVSSRTPVHSQTRAAVRQLIGSAACTVERIAAELGLHPRTLHRRLSAEGRSFQQIKDEVRRDAAIYYLNRTDLDFTAIAGRLGYSEHSVFSRSCTRWFASPPSEMRLRARSSGLFADQARA